MSDGQTRAEHIEAVKQAAREAAGPLDDETQTWHTGQVWRVSTGVAPLVPVARESVASEERQRQRDHELAMARVENEAALVEARVRLASAWQAFDAWTLAGVCSVASAVLTGIAVAAALR